MTAPPSTRRIDPLRGRGSEGLILAVASALVALASFFLRDLDPLIEMTWAVYAYNFATVLLGPLLAGLGVWIGIRYGAAQETIRAAHREGYALARLWLRCTAWVLVGYLFGVAVVVSTASLAGTPGAPPLAALMTVMSAVALLGACLAVGISVGWMTRMWIYVAAVPVVAFSLIVFAYTTQLTLVRVGGATASLAGLTPSLFVSTLQVVLYSGMTIGSLAIAVERRAGSFVTLGASLTLIVIASIGLVGQDETLVASSSLDLECYEAEIVVCVTPEYERYVASFVEAMAPTVDAIRRSGAPVPSRFTQAIETSASGDALIPALRRIEGDQRLVVFGALSNGYVGRCTLNSSAELTIDELDAISTILDWLDRSIRSIQGGLPVEYPDQTAAAFEVVSRC